MNSVRDIVHTSAFQKAMKIEVAADPLGASVELQHQVTVFPYGLPVQVKSNDQRPIKAAVESWGVTRRRYHEKPVEVRVIVSAAEAGEPVPLPTFRAQANLMTIVADAQNHACCDLSRGFGYALLTEAVVADKGFLRCNFIEAMAYTMLDVLHLVVIHAACVLYNGRGVLLVGESGAGKSSLAYACARRGWSYISDDATALYRRGCATAALGNSRTFRFRPGARELFPEIAGTETLRNGKPTIELCANSSLGIVRADECKVDVILFLNRSATLIPTPSLRPICPERAQERLFWQKYPEELHIQRERFSAVQGLLRNSQHFEFTYRDLSTAIDLLESSLCRL